MVTKKRVIAAIGNFDGVHLGHQHLLHETAGFAASHDAAPAVITFDPHPRRYFRPDDPPFLLTTPSQREELLRAHGATEIFTLRFDAAIASLTPKAFIEDVLATRLGLAGIVTGADFRFGKDRAGGVAAMQELGPAAGLAVHIVDVVEEGSHTEKIGSSAVRAALQEGDPKAAAALLGRPWAVRGVVRQGQKIGRTLGFPTANLTLGDIVAPRPGVYASLARVNGKPLPAASYYGRRPTVSAAEPLFETFIFEFEGDLYGKEIEVALIDFIRGDEKFEGLDALKAQIAADCARAREILGGR